MVRIKNVLLIVLTVITAYLLINNIIHQREKKSSNLEDIERLREINEVVLKKIDSLNLVISNQDRDIDSIEKKITKNQKTLENEISKINRMREEFKDLPDDIRDRLLLDYIRANQ